jgi:hypothetical protein
MNLRELARTSRHPGSTTTKDTKDTKDTKEDPVMLACVLCDLCGLQVGNLARLAGPFGYLVFLFSVVAPAAAQTPRNDITVRTSLDRTAVFVGDRVTYTIELTCARGVDVLADDLSRDKLRLEGLEVVDGDTDRRSAPDGATISRFRYILTTYRVDVPALKIAPITVRYAVRRAGQPLEEAAPAGDVQAPGATIAFRSALAEDENLAGIRSDKPPHARSRRFALLQPIGIGLIIVSTVPALVAVAAIVRRVRTPRVRRSVRAVRHEERTSLETVQAMGVDTIERRRELCTRLDALLRQHLRDACGVPGHSLTPQEVPVALAGRRTNVPVELVAAVLATCEVARYAPAHAMPSADACRQAIEHVEQIVAGR